MSSKQSQTTSTRVRAVVAAIVLVPLLGAAAMLFAATPLYQDDFDTAVAHREADWSGSNACRSCHPDQYASWHRTFHRTMTQRPDRRSVRGDFESGEVITLWGVPVRPRRDGDRYFFDYLEREGGAIQKTLEVVYTVGSRRYQQYVVNGPAGTPGNNLFRIPILWHIGDERWIHLNGAFLNSDNGQSFDSHLAVWNQNCIMCHNTGPVPGLTNYEDMLARALRGERIDSARDSLYDSEVAELGISCESCHAPGGEHVARNRNPLRRYALYRSGRDDPTIVNPGKLDQQRSVDVCGQCHGQRLPNPADSIRQWMTNGPIYRAGERLGETVTPVDITTQGPANSPDMFNKRFWPDGTPRLTAYEYQGITSSACFLKGELTCLSCHDMHGGDVNGQIRPEMRTNQACAGCHEALVNDVAAHSHHEPESSGSLCYSCHMPKMMYGVIEIHRSHRIHSPDPAHDAEHARPNACTNCHLDKSALWAADRAREMWGEKFARPGKRGDGAPLELADVTAAVLAGDPVQRAVAARLAGRSDSPLSSDERTALWPLLIQVMQDDYATVRYLARKSLMALDRERPIPGMAQLLDAFDYIAPAPERAEVVDQMLRRWGSHVKPAVSAEIREALLLDENLRLIRARVDALLRLQANKDIDVGE